MGIPATALGTLTPAQIQAALDVASGIVDSYLRGRYLLPLQAWGKEITKATCLVAAFDVIDIRGRNSAAGADPALFEHYMITVEWLRGIQRRAVHPNVTPAFDPAPAYEQPMVITRSVINAAGGVGTNRGW